MSKAAVVLLAGTAGAESGTSITALIVAVIVVTAAVVLALNALGLLPRGKTAERLKLDRDVAEEKIRKLEATVVDNQARISELERDLRSRPDLREHSETLRQIGAALAAHDERVVKLITDHDERMVQISSDAAEMTGTLLGLAGQISLELGKIGEPK